jgi:predicted nuclease with TOPRIM domain
MIKKIYFFIVTNIFLINLFFNVFAYENINQENLGDNNQSKELLSCKKKVTEQQDEINRLLEILNKKNNDIEEMSKRLGEATDEIALLKRKLKEAQDRERELSTDNNKLWRKLNDCQLKGGYCPDLTRQAFERDVDMYGGIYSSDDFNIGE